MDWTEIDREDLRRLLADLSHAHMPFGKYGPKEFPPTGVPLIDLPPEYLSWFATKGFPKGQLGTLMESVWAIKSCGADHIFDPIRAAQGGRHPLRKKRPRSFKFKDDGPRNN